MGDDIREIICNDSQIYSFFIVIEVSRYKYEIVLVISLQEGIRDSHLVYGID